MELTETGFVLGLDLGQSNDYSALAVLRQMEEQPEPAEPDERERRLLRTPFMGERTGAGEAKRPAPAARRYHCVHLRRWPIGTPYTAVVADTAERMQRPEVRGRATLVLDRTGVGAAVFDMFSKDGRLSPVGIAITGGERANPAPGGWTVPKKDLAAVLQATLQTGRLKIAPELPDAALLVKELQDFEVRVNRETGHAQYAADWRTGAHDDLVLALACALWYAERPQPPKLDPHAFPAMRH